MRRSLFAIALAALPAAALVAQPVQQGRPNVPEFTPAFPNQTRAPALPATTGVAVATVAEGLQHPWGIAVLPGDLGYLVTERPGRLRHVRRDGTVSAPITGVPSVHARGQGGLLDITLGPDFASDRVVYLTYAKPLGGGMSATAAARGVLSDGMTALTEVRDIFVQDPPSPTAMHYGSRLTLDDAGHVFITTGEHGSERESVLAQDMRATYGKVVRLRPDGTVPEDNPFAGQPGATAQVWTLGHRNIQGDAMGPDGRYWTIEHGPRGGDELNLSRPGLNYGWPVVTYGENYDGTPVGQGRSRHEGYEEPIYYWDPVIAPGDMVFYDGEAFPDWRGDLLIGSLTPGGMVRLRIEGDRVVGEERLLRDLGRVRDVEVDHDGTVLVITDFARGGLYRLTPAAR